MSKSRLTPEEKRWIKIMEPTINRMVNAQTQTYCRLCGKPVLFTSDSPDYNFERTNQIHVQCYQAYMHQQRLKQMQQQQNKGD